MDLGVSVARCCANDSRDLKIPNRREILEGASRWEQAAHGLQQN